MDTYSKSKLDRIIDEVNHRIDVICYTLSDLGTFEFAAKVFLSRDCHKSTKLDLIEHFAFLKGVAFMLDIESKDMIAAIRSNEEAQRRASILLGLSPNREDTSGQDTLSESK